MVGREQDGWGEVSAISLIAISNIVLSHWVSRPASSLGLWTLMEECEQIVVGGEAVAKDCERWQRRFFWTPPAGVP